MLLSLALGASFSAASLLFIWLTAGSYASAGLRMAAGGSKYGVEVAARASVNLARLLVVALCLVSASQIRGFSPVAFTIGAVAGLFGGLIVVASIWRRRAPAGTTRAEAGD